MSTVEEDIANHLATVLAGAPHLLVYGKNCRPGKVRKASDNQTLTGAIPHKCVFVLQTTGRRDEPWQDGGLKTGLRFPSVQVWVRSNVQAYGDGRSLADAVWDAIDKNPPTGYQEARAGNSGPGYVHEDDMGHHEWSINVDLTKQV